MDANARPNFTGRSNDISAFSSSLSLAFETQHSHVFTFLHARVQCVGENRGTYDNERHITPLTVSIYNYRLGQM